MAAVWLKIKVGTKIAIFAILSLAMLVFLIQNINKPVTVWVWNDYPTTLLKVILATALASVIFTLLLSTTFRTIRQIKEIRAKSRATKLEQEVAEMRAKAAMLQTKSALRNTPNSGAMEVEPKVETDPAQSTLRENQ